MDNRKLAATIKSILFYLSIGVLFYILDCYSLFINDDCIYAFIKGKDTPVMSISDAIQSQIYDYFHANGRFIIHIIVQYFCGVLGLSIFRICNSIMFVLLCIMFTRLLKNEFKDSINNNTTILFIILMMLFGVCRIFLDNIACSVNYLWTSCSILLFLSIWEKEINGPKTGVLHFIMLFLISIIIGSLQESFSFGLAGALFIHAIFKHKEQKKGTIILTVSFIIGSLINILAPSNFIRLKEAGETNSGFFSLISRAFSCFYNSESLLILLALLIVFYIKDSQKCLQFINKNIIIILSIVFNVLFVIFIAYTGSHQLTCIELFSILLIIKLIYTYYPNYITRNNKLIHLICLVILLILYIPTFYCRREISIGHNKLIKNAYQSNDGCIVAKEYYNSCLTKNNWFYKNFTRQEIYNNYCKAGLSGIITNGKNWEFIKSIIPDERINIIKNCNHANAVNKYIYKNSTTPYYIIKLPINNEINELNIEVAYEPATRDWLKRLFNHTGLKYNVINKKEVDSFEEGGIRYYIIYDNIEHKVQDIRIKKNSTF